MAVIVVGGNARNIGKSSVIAGLIAAFPEAQWTAFKITQFGHGICSANGQPCACETACVEAAVSEERDPTTGTDTARFLAAGAMRSLWVRTRQGQLEEAMPRIRRELASANNALIESNSILGFLDPDLYFSVLDPATSDFKTSAQTFLVRADAVLWSGNAPSPGAAVAGWPPGWPPGLLEQAHTRPQFVLGPGYTSPALVQFVARHLKHPATVPDLCLQAAETIQQ